MGAGPLLALLARLTSARATKLDNLDGTITSRASATDYTTARGAKLDNLDDTVTSRASAANQTAIKTKVDSYLDQKVSDCAPKAGNTAGEIKSAYADVSGSATTTLLSYTGSGRLLSVSSEDSSGYFKITIDGGTERDIPYTVTSLRKCFEDVIPLGVPFAVSVVVKYVNISTSEREIAVIYTED